MKLTADDFIPPASASSVKDFSKNYRCCGSCFQRINRNRSTSSNRRASTTISKFALEYTLGKKIGSGGTSVVKLATNHAGEKFAVKIMNRGDLTPADVNQLRREVRILESLNHPNIVRFIQFYEEPSTFFLVLEAIHGGELFDRLAKKTVFSEKEARDIVKVVLNGLKYCHDRNIVHR